MATVAVIPARGGSKRIPRKNIAELGGLPLIAWSIKAARACKDIDDVFVSTEDREIAEISQAFGAKVPFLRKDYADDFSPVSLATAETIVGLRQTGLVFDTVVQLLPTCPLRTESDISNALRAFEGHGRVFQISCFDLGWARPWWAVRLSNLGVPEPLFPAEHEMRSQDLDRLYCPTGAVWVAKADPLIAARTFYGNDHRYEPMPWANAIDVDDPADLELAGVLLQLRSGKVAPP